MKYDKWIWPLYNGRDSCLIMPHDLTVRDMKLFLQFANFHLQVLDLHRDEIMSEIITTDWLNTLNELTEPIPDSNTEGGGHERSVNNVR